MSTMLKSAAMALLSKTLTTFLYKYLSDVDVEGIALPSVYDGSGWGVRLSNVKLREGVQLVKKLPGKLKKTRRRKAAKAKGKKPQKKKSGAVIRPKPQPQNGSSSTQDVARTMVQHQQHDRTLQRPAKQQEQNNNGSALLLDESIHMMDELQQQQQQQQPRIQRKSSKDYFEEDRAEIMEEETDNNGRPLTPDQNPKSIFSCFQKGSHHNSKKNQNVADKQQNGGDDGPASESLPRVLPLHQHPTTPPDRVESELTMETSFHSLSVGNTKQQQPQPQPGGGEESSITMTMVDSDAVLMEMEMTETEYDDKDLSDEEESREDDDEEKEEEEFEEYEQPVRLSLGENGRIGILDIR